METIQNPDPTRTLFAHPRLRHHPPSLLYLFLSFYLTLVLSYSRINTENPTSLMFFLHSTFATLATPSQPKTPKCQVSHPPTFFSFLSCTTCSPSWDNVSKTNIPWKRQHELLSPCPIDGVENTSSLAFNSPIYLDTKTSRTLAISLYFCFQGPVYFFLGNYTF